MGREDSVLACLSSSSHEIVFSVLELRDPQAVELSIYLALLVATLARSRWCSESKTSSTV